MTTINWRLSSVELEARYEGAADPIGKSHFHALWLLSSGYEVEEVAELLSFSTRWVRALVKRYNEGGPAALGDQRAQRLAGELFAGFGAVTGADADVSRAAARKAPASPPSPPSSGPSMPT